MPRNVTIAAVLPMSPSRLYSMYLNPKQHAAFTGAPVKIAARVGAPFAAFGGGTFGHDPATCTESADRPILALDPVWQARH